MVRHGMRSKHPREREGECPLSRKECEGPPRAGSAEGGDVRTRKGHDPMKGIHRWRPQRKRYVGTLEGCDLARCANNRGPKREGPVGKGRGRDRVKGTHLWRP